MDRVPHQEAISHCRMSSAVAFCRAREPVAGDPLRQEVRENHLGHKGAEKFLAKDKNTPHAACHSNPLGLDCMCSVASLCDFEVLFKVQEDLWH